MLKSFIHKYILTKEPWSEQVEVSGKLVISNYNSAFVKSLREQLAQELTTAKTDAEVVKLWTDRYNYERELPKLEVVHGEVSSDGRVNVKLEWNDAFIAMLRNAGVEGESEDDMIRVYLASVTSKVDRDIAQADDIDIVAPTHDIAIQGRPKQPSESDVDQLLEQMDPDVLKMIEKNIRRRAATKRRKT